MGLRRGAWPRQRYSVCVRARVCRSEGKRSEDERAGRAKAVGRVTKSVGHSVSQYVNRRSWLEDRHTGSQAHRQRRVTSKTGMRGCVCVCDVTPWQNPGLSIWPTSQRLSVDGGESRYRVCAHASVPSWDEVGMYVGVPVPHVKNQRMCVATGAVMNERTDGARTTETSTSLQEPWTVGQAVSDGSVSC